MTEEQRKYLSSLMPSILTNTFDKLNNDKDKRLTVKKTKENFSVMTGRENIRMIGQFDTTLEEQAFSVDLANVM